MDANRSVRHVDHQMAKFVDVHPVAGIDEDRRPELFDTGGPAEAITGIEAATQENRAIDRLAFEEYRPPSARAAVRAP